MANEQTENTPAESETSQADATLDQPLLRKKLPEPLKVSDPFNTVPEVYRGWGYPM